MNPLGTVLLALAVPLVWGLVSAWAFDRVREWRGRRKGNGDAGAESDAV